MLVSKVQQGAQMRLGIGGNFQQRYREPQPESWPEVILGLVACLSAVAAVFVVVALLAG